MYIYHFQVSWIRHKDINLLSSGRNLYSSDQRFQIVHNPETEEWTLHVRKNMNKIAMDYFNDIIFQIFR